MQNDILKILRYNTGTDKKVFLKFKNNFDIALINANIVAHSSSAIADLISMYKKEYVIDPQTHIFMHAPIQISSNGKIKKSVEKFLNEMPKRIREIIIDEKRSLLPEDIEPIIDELNQHVYSFQHDFIEKNLVEKEYYKYLEFMGIKTVPKFVIAPYFMLKDNDNFSIKKRWLNINKKCIQKFIKKFNNEKIVVQLVIGQHSLLDDKLLEIIKETYKLDGYEYIFLWIDDFYTFRASNKENQVFKNLISFFNSINKKVVNIYGGYDSILMCHKDSPNRLFGVAQSSGYGEYRKVTPIGGGLPTNKYYFYPTHFRMSAGDASKILSNEGYLGSDYSINVTDKANLYYDNICNCEICKDTIKNNINNFDKYLAANSFSIKSKKVHFKEIDRQKILN